MAAEGRGHLWAGQEARQSFTSVRRRYIGVDREVLKMVWGDTMQPGMAAID